MGTIASEAAFAAWAPDGARWSEWAKPIAFVQQGEVISTEPIADAALPGWPGPGEPGAVLIVDLPGAAAVYAGVSMAERGFRPVPLFNGTQGPSPVIDVSPITIALGSAVERLARTAIARDAPPAFLLDSRRSGAGALLNSGAYDNRWVALPQDFPSGALLASHGFRTAMLLQHDTMSIPPDLAHVLRRWQDSGLRVRVVDVTSGRAEDVTVPKPSRFKLAWYVAAALIGLRRSNVGGFGSVIPVPSSGGYG